MNQNSLILKDSFNYFLSKFYPGIISFIFLIIFNRILGLSGYGLYSIYIYQFNLIVSICFGWLNQAELRYGNNINSSKSRPENLLLIFALSSFIVSVLFTFFIHSSLSLNNIFLCFFCVFSMGVYSYLKTIYQSILKSRTVAIFAIIQSSLFIILPLLALLLFQVFDASILLLSTGLSFFISMNLILIKNFKLLISPFFQINKKIKINNLKWFKYGIPVSIWSTMGLLMPFLDRYFINENLGAEYLGIYSSINELTIRVFSFLIFPFTMAIHPRITKSWNEGNKKNAILLINKSIKYVLVFMFLILFLLIIFDDFIFKFFKIIIPAIPQESKKIIAPLIMTGIMWQLSFFVHKKIELSEKTYLMILFLSISIIINLIGNIFFLPKVGLIATAFASLLSASLYCAFCIFFHLKKTENQ